MSEPKQCKAFSSRVKKLSANSAERAEFAKHVTAILLLENSQSAGYTGNIVVVNTFKGDVGQQCGCPFKRNTEQP